jgi:hypothetical protein
MTKLRLILLAVAAWFGYKFFSFFRAHSMETEAALSVLIATAAAAWLLAPFAIDLVLGLRRHARHSVHGKWQGRYYSFGMRQIRLYLDEDTIWIAEPDLRAILVPPPGEREWRLLGPEQGSIPGHDTLRGCTEAGLATMLKNRTAHRRASHEMIRFKWWLENEAYPNLRKNPSTSA